jgi:hypothetical protein
LATSLFELTERYPPLGSAIDLSGWGAEQGYLRAGDRICCVYVAGAMVNTCPPGIMK